MLVVLGGLGGGVRMGEELFVSGGLYSFVDKMRNGSIMSGEKQAL